MLENGDRLSRDEFERRYDEMKDLKKAELIEGVVYMPSPVRLKRHAAPHFNVIGWLSAYQVATPGTIGGDNASIRMDTDNEPQPDAFLLIDPKQGGQARIDHEDYVAGGPELVFEISSSSVSYDLGPKLQVYRRNQVREYLIWRVLDRAFDWFVLEEGRYSELKTNEAGIYCSQVFPGLWLDFVALETGNLQRVHEVLKQGLGSAEHASFVKKIRTNG